MYRRYITEVSRVELNSILCFHCRTKYGHDDRIPSEEMARIN